MDYNCVSQVFRLFLVENAKGSLLAINERRFSQLMAQHRASLDRYSAALQRVHSSGSINKGTDIDVSTFLPNHEYWFTNRERQVLCLLIAGHSTKQVAAAIGISFKTVASHRHHIMMKMDVHETASMVRKALFAGLGWESVRLRSSSTARVSGRVLKAVRRSWPVNTPWSGCLARAKSNRRKAMLNAGNT